MLNQLHRRSRTGFTLIEILIIAALIALLSGIAVFSVKSAVDSTKRKATFPDMRAVADSLTTAHFDFGFFPKVGMLHLPTPLIKASQNKLLPDFETFGFPTNQLPQQRVLSQWKGPYVSPPTGRSALSVAPGYICKMRLPNLAAVVPQEKDAWFDWPADPWGTPYVVYLISITEDENGNVTIDWLQSPFDEPNYLAAVVSYGPNRIPGGFATNSPADTNLMDAAEPYMLFTPNVTSPYEMISFEALDVNDYNFQRLSALHNQANDPNFGYLGAPYEDEPGILDPGSDDLIVPLR